jgi:hypothetical protein
MEVTKEVQLKNYLTLYSCYITYLYNKYMDVLIVDFLSYCNNYGVGLLREVWIKIS